ncbi:MAG: F420-0--gamma-glutamyl ligase [Clostridiales bacterium]|jgi:F420-0:gamma-glutamyl ligase-like protein|nr:F420-0--gamma-glutamyl ligase [Clostridiales bacterium]
MTTAEAVAELRPNPGRELTREVEGQAFYRYPIPTHFVEVGESYLELIEKYALPHYQDGDILSMGEKVIALCQGQVRYKDQVKVSLLAKLLSRFAMKNPAGPAMDNIYKMQTAIDLCGWWRVLFAAILSAIGKLFGKHGVFYDFLGKNVRNIDGFCVVGWEYYADKGVLAPAEPDNVCQEIKEKFGMDCMIVDANDISVEILGKNREIKYDDKFLAELIKDNPAGQSREQTPLILIRQAG